MRGFRAARGAATFALSTNSSSIFAFAQIQKRTVMQTNLSISAYSQALLFVLASSIFASCYFQEGAFSNKNNCLTPVGATVSRSFDTEDFSIVFVPDEWSEVTIEKGDNCQITFEGREEMLDAIELSTRDKALQFSLNKCFNSSDKLKVRMTLKTLQKLSNNTFSAPVHVRGFVGNALEISNDESAVMDFDVDYKHITCLMNRGKLILTGKTDALDGYFYTSAGLEAFGLEAKSATIVSNSIWKLEIKATEHLNVKINDSGSVYYKGHPAIDSTIVGSGRLIDAN